MDFGLDEDQEAFRATVRTFAREKLAPGYLQRAKSERFPWDIHREVAALGVFGLLAGEPFNPLEHEDFVAAGLVVEELAYADFNMANAAIPALLMSSLIARHGQPAVRQEWLGRLVSGDAYVALGLTEPQCGSDVTAIRTTATAIADGYLLSLFPFQRVRPAIVHWEIKNMTRAQQEATLDQLCGLGYRICRSGTEDMLAVDAAAAAS